MRLDHKVQTVEGQLVRFVAHDNKLIVSAEIFGSPSGHRESVALTVLMPGDGPHAPYYGFDFIAAKSNRGVINYGSVTSFTMSEGTAAGTLTSLSATESAHGWIIDDATHGSGTDQKLDHEAAVLPRGHERHLTYRLLQSFIDQEERIISMAEKYEPARSLALCI
jgi:hypothetical protein